MLWILAVHIVTWLAWCALLLGLLKIISDAQPSPSHGPTHGLPATASLDSTLPRLLFTIVLSPFALVAIVSGTAVFLLNNTTAPWLVLKLTLVACLVLNHALCGTLVLRLEKNKSVRTEARALMLISVLLMLAIAWLVLAKPDLMSRAGSPG